jgi:hypothetical protein
MNRSVSERAVPHRDGQLQGVVPRGGGDRRRLREAEKAACGWRQLNRSSAVNEAIYPRLFAFPCSPQDTSALSTPLRISSSDRDATREVSR